MRYGQRSQRRGGMNTTCTDQRRPIARVERRALARDDFISRSVARQRVRHSDKVVCDISDIQTGLTNLARQHQMSDTLAIVHALSLSEIDEEQKHAAYASPCGVGDCNSPANM